MNKQDCLNAAERADVVAAKAQERAALYIQVFGGSDSLVESTLAEARKARNAASEWRRIADWHHKRRSKALRDQTLPIWMFGFCA